VKNTSTAHVNQNPLYTATELLLLHTCILHYNLLGDKQASLTQLWRVFKFHDIAKQFTDNFFHYCPEPSARDVIAAWPAAVAASLERFLSASEGSWVPATTMIKWIKHTSFLFLFNLCYYGLDLFEIKVLRLKSRYARTQVQFTHCDLSVAFHYTDFNVFGTSLYYFQQTLDCQFDSLFSWKIVLVILFEEFADSFWGTSDGIGLARKVD